MNSGLGNISAVKLIWSPQVMRGVDFTQEALFTTVHLDTFVPTDHPLRAGVVKRLVTTQLSCFSQFSNG